MRRIFTRGPHCRVVFPNLSAPLQAEDFANFSQLELSDIYAEQDTSQQKILTKVYSSRHKFLKDHCHKQLLVFYCLAVSSAQLLICRNDFITPGRRSLGIF